MGVRKFLKAVGAYMPRLLAALAFIAMGYYKLFEPPEVIAANVIWFNRAGIELVRTVGVIELLCAASLLLPLSSRVISSLTALGASVLVADQSLLALIQLRRGLEANLAQTLFLIVLLLMTLLICRHRLAEFRQLEEALQDHPTD
jgi:uncharacterized membrane protein YphA (DoxX/SURF4 family)